MITANIKDRVVMSAQQTAGAGGTSNYEELENLPSVNGHEVIGEKTGHDLGLANLDDIPSIPVYNLNKTKLYDSNSLIYGAPMNTEINLSDDLSKYDIGVLLWNTTQDRSQSVYSGTDFVFFIPSIVLSNNPTNNAYRLHFAGYGQRWGVVTFKNNSFIYDNRGGDLLPEIYQIWGIKLGVNE